MIAVVAAHQITTRRNQAEGSNGLTVSTSNSGGPDQFGAVSLSGSGSTQTYDNAHAHAGSTAVKLHFAAVPTVNYVAFTALPALVSPDAGFIRCYVYMTSLPATNVRILGFYGAGAHRCSLIITTTGTIRTANATGTTIASTTGALPTNAWARIELDLSAISGSNGTVAARMYSGANLETATPDTNGSLSNAAQAIAGAIDEARFGANAAVTQLSARDIWIDDLTYSDTAQPAPG